MAPSNPRPTSSLVSWWAPTTTTPGLAARDRRDDVARGTLDAHVLRARLHAGAPRSARRPRGCPRIPRAAARSPPAPRGRGRHARRRSASAAGDAVVVVATRANERPEHQDATIARRIDARYFKPAQRRRGRLRHSASADGSRFSPWPRVTWTGSARSTSRSSRTSRRRRTCTWAAIMIFEGPPPAYEDLLEHVNSRLHLVPRFRQKLAHPPVETGRPFWIDDPTFNLEYHVRHSALPSPGLRGAAAQPRGAGLLAAARPHQAALGAVARPGPDAEAVRDRLEDPPRARRRGLGRRHRDGPVRPEARARADPGGARVGARPGAVLASARRQGRRGRRQAAAAIRAPARARDRAARGRPWRRWVSSPRRSARSRGRSPTRPPRCR